MNDELVVLVVAGVAVAIFAVVLIVLFVHLRLWIQARLTDTPVALADIIRMRLRNCPPTLIVHAMIELWQRGIEVSASEVEGCYLAEVVRGEPVATASELASLVEAVKRAPPPDAAAG